MDLRTPLIIIALLLGACAETEKPTRTELARRLGVEFSQQPGVCTNVETTLTEHGKDIEAATVALMLDALSSYSGNAEPDAPTPDPAELRAYARGILQGCDVLAPSPIE